MCVPIQTPRTVCVPIHTHTVTLEALYDTPTHTREEATSSVHKCMESISNVVRIVKLTPSMLPLCRRKFTGEVQSLTTLDHPNIVRCFECFDNNICSAIVMEYIPGGELLHLLQQAASPLPEEFSSRVCVDLFNAINYCHSNNIMHRDIKPDNIMFTTSIDPKDVINGSLNYHDTRDLGIKLVDFDLSCKFSKNRIKRETVGTSYYMCPDVINKEYNEKSDIWSLGIVLFMMITGTHPYPFFDNDHDTRQCVLEWKLPQKLSKIFPFKNIHKNINIISECDTTNILPSDIPSVSLLCLHLLSRMLHPSSHNRACVKECLNHPWLLIAYRNHIHTHIHTHTQTKTHTNTHTKPHTQTNSMVFPTDLCPSFRQQLCPSFRQQLCPSFRLQLSVLVAAAYALQCVPEVCRGLLVSAASQLPLNNLNTKCPVSVCVRDIIKKIDLLHDGVITWEEIKYVWLNTHTHTHTHTHMQREIMFPHVK
eukprot:GHVR01076210.1.p1 GENE.GHVR01076210.1~~GHVR01076210.1.p1  ORF type:complete len:506 (+),score=198.32 GHVR01076210.1:83-1519(+)